MIRQLTVRTIKGLRVNTSRGTLSRVFNMLKKEGERVETVLDIPCRKEGSRLDNRQFVKQPFRHFRQ
ncbi:MAG: hypothetical protein ACOCVH_02260, partial [Verrucomicrobiota bacterium]